MNAGFLYLSRDNVKTILELIDPVSVARNASILHASNKVSLPSESYLRWEPEGGGWARSLALSAFVGGEVAMPGTKIINASILNQERGLPRASGLTLLYDATTAQIVVAMEAGLLSALRTAAVTALAVEHLGTANIERLAILGAGALADAHLTLLLPRLETLQTVLLYDTVPSRAASLRDAHATRPVDIQLAASAEEAVKASQVVITLTTTTESYLPLSWLNPGALLVNASLSDALPEVFLQSDRLFVDSWDLVQSDAHRTLGHLIRTGLICAPGAQAAQPTARAVDAEFGQVVAGFELGRTGAREIIVFNPFGMASQDVALATAVYRHASYLRIGQLLPF